MMEARRCCDEIAHGLKLIESSIRGMFSDVQALKDGRYHQAEQMYKRYLVITVCVSFCLSNDELIGLESVCVCRRLPVYDVGKDFATTDMM